MEKIVDLREKLRRWSAAYYAGTPEVVDSVFDTERDCLERLAPDDIFFSEVGAPTASEKTCKHKIPMFSLKKCSSPDEFIEWYTTLPEGTELTAQLKLDGCSVNLEYEDGNLIRGLLRGDGITGEDYTENIRRCKTLRTSKVDSTFTGSVRGEAVINIRDFTPKNFPHKTDPEKTESNRRNSATGAIRKENSKRVEYVEILCYDIECGRDFSTDEEKMKEIERLGFPGPETISVRTLNQALDLYENILSNRSSLPYMVDGIVFKINNLEKQVSMGYHQNYPKGMRALKFPYMTGESTLTDLEICVGHTGALTPRGHYEPIIIDGREFKHASLYNWDFINQMDLGIGDKIIIGIGGDIIPKIVGRTKGKNRAPIAEPTECPICGKKVVRDGAKHFCKNKNCSGIGLRKVRQWIKQVDIKFLGPEGQKSCYDSGLILDPADLYSVSVEALGNIIGEGNAKRVIEEVNAHRDLPLHIFMGSLGINLLGRRKAEMLVNQGVNTIERFLNLNPSDNFDGFNESLPSIVEEINHSRPLIKKLLDSGVQIKDNSQIVTGSMSGKKFVITGTLSKGRKEVASDIEKAGGTISSSLSSNTDYLVAGEKTGSKLGKAIKAGVKVINESELYNLLK